MIDRATFDAAVEKMGPAFLNFFDATKVLIAADATSKYMREGIGQEGTPNPTDTLRIVSGRLARSLVNASESRTGTREGVSDISLNPARMEYGSRVPYAAVHEYGFTGTVEVPAHTRTISQAFGRSIPQRDVSVSAHSRRMFMPARPYLTPSFEGLQDTLAEMLAERVTEAIIEAVEENE